MNFLTSIFKLKATVVKKTACITVVLVLSAALAQAQQTMGLFIHTDEAFEGYTLFAPLNSTETYLIDNCGEKVHSWTSAYEPGLSCYLLADGTLVRSGKITEPGQLGGIIEMLDWESNVIWDYSAASTHGWQHHDFEVLPNGNILLIVWDIREREEVLLAGGTTDNESVISEQIIEVQPDLSSGEASVVWEWKVWDHLIQEADSSLNNFGVVAQTPEKVDINFLGQHSSDWFHFNAIDYNETFDQIMVSVHRLSECWIIDHSTSTIEAAGSSGGNYGKGGDLLYRWGNPQVYKQGTPGDQQLFSQHHPHWIEEGLPEAGKILVFNNQAGTHLGINASSVDIFQLPANEDGTYQYNGGAFGPFGFDWTYQAPTPTDFFSHIVSGAQRLPNGNTLICEGASGRFFEINEEGLIVWEYINPVNNHGPLVQGESVSNNIVFRCTRYAPDYPGLAGRELMPQGYIETGSDFSCDDLTSVQTRPHPTSPRFNIYPNPAVDYLNISAFDVRTKAIDVGVFKMDGSLLYEHRIAPDGHPFQLNISNLKAGIYLLKISTNYGTWTKKIVVLK